MAQKNAANSCLNQHPVLKLGENQNQRKDWWNHFVTTISKLPCTFNCEIISGVENCPMTLYCRVRLSCFQNNIKIFESTAAGISFSHAQTRAAQKLMEEPTYGAKPVLKILQERKLNVKFILEKRKEDEIMQKCLLQFKSAHDAAEQEFYAEGLTAKLAKTKAVEKLLKQTFGPDMSKKHDREITSIKAIKPFNRNGDQDPPLPSSCKESHLDDCIPDLNAEHKRRYEQAAERLEKRMAQRQNNSEGTTLDEIPVMEDVVSPSIEEESQDCPKIEIDSDDEAMPPIEKAPQLLE